MLRKIIIGVVVVIQACSYQAAHNDLALTRVKLGLAYLQQGQYLLAELNLKKALQIAPRQVQVQLAMLRYLTQTGRFDDARLLFERSLERYPRHAQVLHNYGTFLCQRGEYKKSAYYLEQATQLAPSAHGYENMARCAAKYGFLSECTAHLHNLVRAAPKQASILLEFGQWFIDHEHLPQAHWVIRTYENEYQQQTQTEGILGLKLQLAHKQGRYEDFTKFGEQLKTVYPSSQYTEYYLKYD